MFRKLSSEVDVAKAKATLASFGALQVPDNDLSLLTHSPELEDQ